MKTEIKDNRLYGSVVVPSVKTVAGPGARLRYGRIELELVDGKGNVYELYGAEDIELYTVEGNGVFAANLDIPVDIRLEEDDE